MKKESLFAAIDQRQAEILSWGNAFFDCAELGFQEVKTAAAITALLDQWNIPYESGIAMTGIRVTLGSGSPHIAFVSDMDALPCKSKNGTVHSCGHSIQTTLALTLIRALDDCGLPKKNSGRISFFFTPAEEFIDFTFRDQCIAEGKIRYRSGKQNMIAEGYFDDVDCVLSAHANGETEYLFDINSTLAGFLAKKAVFLGTASHSGAAPHLGRNALHGAVLAQNALAFLKDRFPASAGLQLHPVITEGGGTVNIIPDRTVMETYIRANDNATLFAAEEQVDQCIHHCAAALGLGCETETTPGYLPLRQSAEMNEMVLENMLLFCEEDQILRNVVSGASGDIGDLGFLLPAVQMGFSGIKGQFHNDNFTIADKENCYIRTAKVLAGTLFDLLQKPMHQPAEFAAKKEKYLKQLEKRQNLEIFTES